MKTQWSTHIQKTKLIFFYSETAQAIEILLRSCADENSDVRLTANDCINVILTSVNTLHIHKILVEFFKEIKKVFS